MASARLPVVTYLAFDLGDAAVRKRVTMLRVGGAAVRLGGFRRGPAKHGGPADSVETNVTVTDFGPTYNGRFLQRIGAVLRTVLRLPRLRLLFTEADVILARNLEMLAIAALGRALFNPGAALVYECLDIHRLVLNRGVAGMALRALEGLLARRAQALLTSSPEFVRQYFQPRSWVRLPVRLIENKLLVPQTLPPPPARPAGPPWCIGWFGIIRCRKSLEILTALARTCPGQVEIVIRGRPALDQIPDFHARIAAAPGLRYEGPYTPDELPALYGAVHFSWAIDRYEEGQNSAWLLPNRLYEGGAFGAVPLAEAGTAAAAMLERLGIGVRLAGPLAPAAQAFFQSLTPEAYGVLAAAACAVPSQVWTDTPDACAALVAFLRKPDIHSRAILPETYYAPGDCRG